MNPSSYTPLGSSGLSQTPVNFGAPAPASATPAYTPLGGAGLQTAPVTFGALSPSNTQPPPSVSQTMDANALSKNQNSTSLQFPSNPPSDATSAANATSANTSIPSIASITSQEATQTPAESTNSSLLTKLAGLIGGQSSLATQQTNAESAAGIPAMNKTVNDLNTQLQGLTDQATALATAAQPGGQIQNQEQNAAQGRGVTAGGLAPISSADLRNNQIQQSTIAQRSLTLKSAIYAAQGSLTLAKDAADKAAQVAFDADTQKINYMNALIDANKPQMTKEEQAQADTVKAQLADRSNQITQQQDNFKTGQASIADAMKNNPNDPNAQYAAQQAMQLDPHDPQYLQKVQGLIGQYGSDVAARNLDQALKSSQLKLANMQLGGSSGSLPGTTGNGGIDATSAGYTTDSVAGGLSQASIDQKALLYLTSGTLPPQGRTGVAGLQNAAISNRMAEMAPGGNLAANKAQLGSLSSSLKQQTEYLNTTQRAFNTANDTLASLQSFMAKNNINPSQFPDFNSFSNYLKSKGMDPGAAGGYNAQIATLRAEYSQVLAKGGVRSVETDQQAAKLIPDGLSPAALAQVASQIKTDGTNVTNDAQKQVSQIQDQINGIIGGGSNQSGTNSSSTTLPPEIDTALSQNAKVDQNAKTVTIPRSVWSGFGTNMDAVKAGIKAKGYDLLIGN